MRDNGTTTGQPQFTSDVGIYLHETESSVSLFVDNYDEVSEAFDKPVQHPWLGVIESTQVESASAGWGYADVPIALFGDDGRKVRLSNVPEYLVWYAPGLQTFEITLYVQTERLAQLSGLLLLEVSNESSGWHKAQYDQSDDNIENGWSRVVITGKVTTAADRFKLTLGMGADAATMQLGKVVLQRRK